MLTKLYSKRVTSEEDVDKNTLETSEEDVDKNTLETSEEDVDKTTLETSEDGKSIGERSLKPSSTPKLAEISPLVKEDQ